MVTKNLNKIFLSASVPLPERDPLFYETADFVSIRDAVRAIATVIVPKAHLVWGGHPSITPVIRYVTSILNVDLKKHVTLYQSQFFEQYFPEDNSIFENIHLTEKKKTREESLEYMRIKMISENDFKVGIFIGGMEGILEEYSLFKQYHPEALILPVASTGAASKILFEINRDIYDLRLLSSYAYMALFRDLLEKYIE